MELQLIFLYESLTYLLTKPTILNAEGYLAISFIKLIIYKRWLDSVLTY